MSFILPFSGEDVQLKSLTFIDALTLEHDELNICQQLETLQKVSKNDRSKDRIHDPDCRPNVCHSHSLIPFPLVLLILQLECCFTCLI